MIYFDNGATTFPKPQSVINAVSSSLKEKGANPGRSGYKLALQAAELVYKSRSAVAEFFGASSPENVIFTPNCTTALNTVIKGILKKGDHAVISSLEHNAVARPLETLKKIGVSYSIAEFVPYDDDKTIDNFRNAINSNTKLVICTHASNVFGFKLPIDRIGAMCKIYDIKLCVDAAQTAGIIPINLADSYIDYLCTAGHKGLYGPMGTGLMIINNEKTPESLVQGGTGSQSEILEQPDLLPDKYESGTVNLSGIAGLAEGIRFVKMRNPEKILKHEIILIQSLYDKINKISGVELYTQRPDERYFVPVLSFNIKGMDSESVAMKLSEKYNIAVRAGLHCAPLAHKSMNTIDGGTVRVVLSVFTNEQQILYLADCVRKIAKSI